ncbi:MAG: isoprenylcysteine carboxylmethyltransferase family protein [Ignavibacteriaceae bacterium]|jgi:protein-S-isoprenylcysteine O-methyltransferase Ste14
MGLKSGLTKFLFTNRSYTPIPFIVLMLIFQDSNIWSLTGGFLLLIIGEFIRFRGVSIAGSETRTTGKVGGTNLVISGPFAYVRNPLYVGNILIYTGAGIMSFAAFPYFQIIGFIYFVFQYYLIVLEEEGYLRKEFGKEYDNYFKNVPRFIPRLTKYKNPEAEQPLPDYKEGLRSERRTLQAITIVVITILLIHILRRLSF